MVAFKHPQYLHLHPHYQIVQCNLLILRTVRTMG